MRISTTLGLLGASLALSACGGGGIMRAEIDAAKSSKAKVAVVSISVNDFGGALQNPNNSDVGELIDMKMNEMLSLTETKLKSMYTVVPAESFAANDKFQSMSAGEIKGVFHPSPGGKYMPRFSESRGDLVAVHLEPAQATELCEATGSDLVVVVYSEWATRTGGFVPITKPLAKNVLSMYDKQGRRLFKSRKDVVGKKTLGALGRAVVDDETISAWIDAYETGLDQLLDQM